MRRTRRSRALTAAAVLVIAAPAASGVIAAPAASGAIAAPAASGVIAAPAASVTNPVPATLVAIPAPAAPQAAPVGAGDKSASFATVQSASRQGYGRVLLNTNGKVGYQVDQDGDHVVIHLTGNVVLGAPPAAPHNVLAIKTDGAVLDLLLSPATKLRPTRVNGHIVLDILDNATPPPAPGLAAAIAKAQPRPPLSMATSPELGGRSAPRPEVTQTPVIANATPPEPPAAPQPAPDADAGTDTVQSIQPTAPGRDHLPENEGPIGLRARHTRLPKDVEGAAFLVPFEATIGAAAFDKAGSTYVVFDERRPVDMAALATDPVFSKASVRLVPNGTVLQLPHAPNLTIVLSQLPQGWRITAIPATPKRQPIVASYADGHLNLAAEQPGDVVNLADPVTGATLLVGTQHKPGQAVLSERRSTEFVLQPTLQGVVVEPLSDSVSLRQTATGFSLSGGPGGLALSPVAAATPTLIEAAHLTRRLNLPTMPSDALLRLAVKQLGDASKAPPLARGPRRHAAAESFLALGLSAEAQSLLRMAAEQDPKEAASPDNGALSAAAALMAGRPEEAGFLRDPKLDGTDEITLWRAILQATQDEGSSTAATAFATTASLVFQYPAPVREHVLPLIVETMIQGGQVAAAARMLEQCKDDPRLNYARALMRQIEGNMPQALEILDGLANGRDQLDRMRAAVHAVELRLQMQEIDKTQAADALDKLLYAWRGDARELALRQRVAELRGQTGAWRTALSIQRQAENDFPDQAPGIHARLKDTFAAMIHDDTGGQMPPLEFVATVDENTDLLPDVNDDEAVERPLADRLLALDLPSRARPVLEKLMQETKSDTAKARFGISLATLQAHEGNDAAAMAALDASQAQGLPPELQEQRLILRAVSMAHTGDAPAAAALLAPLRSAHGIEARAEILETAGDWDSARQAWSNAVALSVPETGMLDDAQARILLRLATATARAHDDAGLSDLRSKYQPRIAPGPLSDMFRLLTAEPVKSLADIKRSQMETNIAAALPADLKALQAKITPR